MSKKKSNPTLTIIVAIVVPIILFLIVSDIASDLRHSWQGDGDTKAMFAWVIYIGIVGVFEYFWLTRSTKN